MNTTPTPTSSKLEQIVRQGLQWIQTHREQFWAIAGTTAGALFLIVFMINKRQSENDEAWTQLGVAQGYLLQNQMDQTAKALDQWTTRFKGSSASAYAQFLRADLQYRTSDYVQAANTYADLSETAQPPTLRPLALSAQVAAEEMAGHLPEAQSAAQRFLEKYPDHYLAANVFISQARLAEMTGNASGAAALYDRFAILYPQSPWTAFARARLQNLSAPAPSSPPLLNKK